MLQAAQQQAFARILTTVAGLKASDLHLTVGNPPILRIDGELKQLQDEEIMTPEVLQSLIDGLLTEKQKQQFEQHKDITLSYTFMDRIRFRMNVFYQKGYPAMSLRFIPDRIPNLGSLGLPEAIGAFLKLEHGLILITGPFGSGKTTTISALVQMINAQRSDHIVMVEDPIEYLFINDKSVIEQREVGRDAESMLAALELADREDVDIIVASGMKSDEVIRKVIDLSTTDRLVIASLAADSIDHALNRIVVAYPEDQRTNARHLLAQSLQGIICQHLLRRIGGGLVLVPELLIPNTPARSIIREGTFGQLANIIQTSREQGMVARDSVLVNFVQNGVITPEEARAYAHDKDQIDIMIRR